MTASMMPVSARAQPEHDGDDESQRQHVAQDGDQTRGEQFVEHVDVGGDARHQPADRIAVEECDVQPLQVRHQLAAQVEHGALAGVLHDVRLAERREKTADEHTQVEQRDLREAGPAVGATDTGQ